jgi:hypothetical protein
MKTTVMGVFPHEADARRVMSQLVASTLDLDAIRVLHKQPEVQRAMAAEAGLPADRSVPAGTVTGALLGGAIGFGLGLTPDLPLAQVGPLFLGALGLLAGGVAGGVLGGLTDALPVPREQLPELTESVDGGATVVLVRTDSLPTARAIRDLFQAAGSDLLAPVPAGSDVATEGPAPTPYGFGEPAAAMVAAAEVDEFVEPAPVAQRAPAAVPFWRRLFRRRGAGAAPARPADLGAYAGPDADLDHSLFMPPPASTLADPTVAPWERSAPPDAEPAMYQPPQAADVAEDAAPPRRRRKAAAAVEDTAPQPDEPPPP